MYKDVSPVLLVRKVSTHVRARGARIPRIRTIMLHPREVVQKAPRARVQIRTILPQKRFMRPRLQFILKQIWDNGLRRAQGPSILTILPQ